MVDSMYRFSFDFESLDLSLKHNSSSDARVKEEEIRQFMKVRNSTD